MSNLTDLVPPLELCKKIPAGEFQDSTFYWFADLIKINETPPHEYKYTVHEADYKGYNWGSFRCCPAPTLQEIMEAVGGIKEISYPDELNPGRTLCRDPRFEPSIEYFPNGNFTWVSMRWTTSIWQEKETSATAAALRTYLSIKKVEVTMPCPECGTWMHRPDDEHPEYESMDDYKIQISEFCPECGFKFYDEPFLYILEPAKKYLLWVDTPMGSRWKKKQSDQSDK